MRSLRINGAIIAVLLVVGALLSSSFGSDKPRLGNANVSTSTSLSAEDADFVAYMYPRVTALDRDLTALSKLIDARSRNLFALQAHNGRIRNLIGEIRTWSGSHPTPPRFSTSNDQLESSSIEILGLLNEAGDAQSAFDFSGVTALVPRFDLAVQGIRQVKGTLAPYIESESERTIEAQVDASTIPIQEEM